MAAHLCYVLERRSRTFGRTELLSEEERVAALMLSVASQPCRCSSGLHSGLLHMSIRRVSVMLSAGLCSGRSSLSSGTPSCRCRAGLLVVWQLRGGMPSDKLVLSFSRAQTHKPSHVDCAPRASRKWLWPAGGCTPAPCSLR